MKVKESEILPIVISFLSILLGVGSITMTLLPPHTVAKLAPLVMAVIAAGFALLVVLIIVIRIVKRHKQDTANGN